MALEIVVGTQWGDEGKGRIVDLLSADAAVVARWNGGDNAGHTVDTGKQTFKLHLIPSGIVHTQARCVLGNGVVVNPATLLEEIQALRDGGIPVTPARLRISYAAHLITPAHRVLDQAQEAARGGDMIGTTGRGIGPAYTDRAARRGLRAEDLLDPERLRNKVYAHVHESNHLLEDLYGADPLDPQIMAREYQNYAEQLWDYVGDAADWIDVALNRGERVLAEGAQGTLLDLDFGTYPFVTSSNPLASGALAGLGIGVRPVDRVLGVTKAFQTRFGAGPFPTEVVGHTAVRLRGTGANPWDEFGTTTGRPQRVGWLDGVLLRYAVRANGLTELAVTKLDVLTGLDTIYVCTAYRAFGREYDRLPLGPADLSPFEPVYQGLPGWRDEVQSARSWEDLPTPAQHFIRQIEAIAGIPVRLVSVGPERDQVVEIETA